MQPACPKIMPHQDKEDKILIVLFIGLQCWRNIISSQSILIASTVKTCKTKQPTIPGLGCTYAYIKPARLQKYRFKTAMAYPCSSFQEKDLSDLILKSVLGIHFFPSESGTLKWTGSEVWIHECVPTVSEVMGSTRDNQEGMKARATKGKHQKRST